MQEIHFTNLLIVTAVAFAAPLVLGFAPRLRLPAVVLEIVAGIVVGPSGLGWVEVDLPVDVLAVIGLAFLLFLAGLEIDPRRLRGRTLRVTALGFALSFVVGIVAGLGLDAAGFVKDPMFAAIVLVSTSLGVVVPVLKDSDQIGSDFGQLVIAAASIADFAAVHRRRDDDRPGPRRDLRSVVGRVHRRGPALGGPLPGDWAGAVASRGRRAQIHDADSGDRRAPRRGPGRLPGVRLARRPPRAPELRGRRAATPASMPPHA